MKIMTIAQQLREEGRKEAMQEAMQNAVILIDRERENTVLRLIAKGMNTKEVSEVLDLPPKAIEEIKKRFHG